MARAVDCVLGSLFGESQAQNEETRVFGLVGSPGVYEGTARVVFGHESFGRIEPGDVLVAHSTSEAFNALLPLLGAIVSDSGGALSHAAIVAREFGIPAVVGTREATKLIPDGARVRVDAENGVVEILA
jgi:pyruvate,water dikinase